MKLTSKYNNNNIIIIIIITLSGIVAHFVGYNGEFDMLKCVRVILPFLKRENNLTAENVVI